MTGPENAARPRRRLLIVALAVAVLILAAALYVRSGHFDRWVRGQVIADLEDVTGGRVELGRLQWNLSTLSLVADDLTIHGLEPPNEVPYVHVDRVRLAGKVLSLLGRDFGWRYLELEHPAIRLVVDREGHTNQPTPKAIRITRAGLVQRLFGLQVDHAVVKNGVLLVNDRPMPLDFSARDVQAQMSYLVRTQQYQGGISVDEIGVAYQQLRPFTASAEVQFILLPNRFELQSLKLTSGNSTAQASGELVDFHTPKITLTYRSTIDLQQAGAIAHAPELRRGVMEINGSGTYTEADFITSGKLQLRDLEYRAPGLHVAGVDGGAEFTANKNDAALPHLFLRLMGGAAAGSAEIRHWSSRPGAQPEQQGSARLRLSNLQAGRAAAALATAALPLDHGNIVGAAGGAVNIAWRGSPAQAQATFDLEVAPPPSAAPGQLPINAQARGAYTFSGQMLSFAELRLAARSVQLTASGTMAGRSQMRFNVLAGDVRDLDPLLRVFHAAPFPAGLTGRASITGTLAGRLAAPVLTGHLALTGFTLPLPLAWPAAKAKPAPHPRLAQFDSLSTDFDYSPSKLTASHGLLRRGAEQVSFNLGAALRQGRFDETSPLTAQLNVRNFQFADLQGLAGFDYPVTGVVTATLQVSGTRADPRGGGHVQITKAAIKGEPFQLLSGDLVFAQREAQVGNLQIVHNGGRVAGTAAYGLQTAAFRFNLVGRDFRLANFRQLQSARMPVGGLLDFDARGSGTADAPVINADLHLRELTLGGERVGGMEATAVTSAGVLRLTARTVNSPAAVDLEGTIGMRGDFPANLALRIAHLDVDPLLGDFLKGHVTGHSSLSGAVQLSGPLREPARLQVRGDIAQFSANLESVRIANQGPLRFTVAEQTLRLDQFQLVGDDTQLSATGTVGLAANGPMNLRADGHLNLKLLQTWNPNLHSAGSLDFGVRARGTPARPTLVGQARITDGALADINFPNGLSDINGVLLFNQDRMQIQNLTASTGGGSVVLGGFVSYSNGLAFNVTASGKDIRLRSQGVSTSANADLRLSGTPAASTLGGNLVVTKFSMSPQFDVARFIAASKQPPEPPSPNSFLNNVRLNVRVVSTPELQVQTSLAKVTGDVDLTLRGTATRPVLLGRLNMSEGQVTFNGATYQLDRGDVTFSNPVRTEPVLDVEVTTRVQRYDVTLGFHGPLDRLSTTYRSDPPLPVSDIIALLAFGRTREESAIAIEPNPTFSESASNAILSQALASTQSNRMQRLFGVSRIRIAPEETGATTDPNARVTIEQQVSKDFTVTYVTDLAHSGQQIIQVEYNYSRNFSILASRDQYGVVSFDVRLRRRRK